MVAGTIFHLNVLFLFVDFSHLETVNRCDSSGFTENHFNNINQNLSSVHVPLNYMVHFCRTCKTHPTVTSCTDGEGRQWSL